MSKQSQIKRILSLLRKGIEITNRDAKLYYGVPNLYLHISRLRERGYRIDSKKIETVNGTRKAYIYPQWKQLFDNTGRVLAKWFR